MTYDENAAGDEAMAAFCQHPDHFSDDRARMLAHPCAEEQTDDGRCPACGDPIEDGSAAATACTGERETAPTWAPQKVIERMVTA